MSNDELLPSAGMKSLHCKRLNQALILLFKCIVWDLLIVGTFLKTGIHRMG